MFAEKKFYKQIQLECGNHRLWIYNINHANEFYNNLKKFIDKFRCISTKHIDNYLNWNIYNNMTSKEIINAVVVLVTSGHVIKF